MPKLHLVPRSGAPAVIANMPRLPLHPMTLRLRLTFWYSAVLAFIIALFGMVVYGGTSFVLIRQIDTNLQGTAKTIVSTSHLRPSFDAQALYLPPLDRF